MNFSNDFICGYLVGVIAGCFVTILATLNYLRSRAARDAREDEGEDYEP